MIIIFSFAGGTIICGYCKARNSDTAWKCSTCGNRLT